MKQIDLVTTAKEKLQTSFAQEPWFKGVGIEVEDKGVFTLVVNSTELNDTIDQAIPNEIDGIEVDIQLILA